MALRTSVGAGEPLERRGWRHAMVATTVAPSTT